MAGAAYGQGLVCWLVSRGFIYRLSLEGGHQCVLLEGRSLIGIYKKLNYRGVTHLFRLFSSLYYDPPNIALPLHPIDATLLYLPSFRGKNVRSKSPLFSRRLTPFLRFERLFFLIQFLSNLWIFVRCWQRDQRNGVPLMPRRMTVTGSLIKECEQDERVCGVSMIKGCD